MKKATSVALLGVAIASAMGGWWLFAGEAPRAAPPPAPVSDDLDLVASLLDGSTTEPPHDLLLAGAGELYLARSGDGSVVTLTKTGAGRRTLAHLEGPARGMALAAGALWLTTKKAVEKVPVAGGESQQVAGDLGRPGAIACDGTWVFVVDTETGSPGLTHANAVVRIPTSGGEKTVLGRSEGEITNLVFDETHVYWPDRLEGSIVAVPKAGGARQVLATDRGLPGSMAIGGDALYWVEKRSESLWTMPKTGGTPRQVAQDFAGFANVVVDARGIFWSGEAAVYGTFTVLTAPSQGDEAVAISPSVPGIDALASDGTRLFWDRAGDVSVVPPLKD
jgi:hypothetical protein